MIATEIRSSFVVNTAGDIVIGESSIFSEGTVVKNIAVYTKDISRGEQNEFSSVERARCEDARSYSTRKTRSFEK